MKAEYNISIRVEYHNDISKLKLLCDIQLHQTIIHIQLIQLV